MQNIGFAQRLENGPLKVRLWERGHEEIHTCAEGVCAAAVAAVLKGICPNGQDIRIKLRGGELTAFCSGNGTVVLTGDARHVFQGVIEL